MIRAVLFDLDGTLMDTAPDLIRAVNRLRVEHGLPPVPASVVRPFVSKGGTAMILAAFPHLDEAARAPLLQPFLDHYRAHIFVASRLFEGFDALLALLEARGIKIGIVTNKPGWLTEPLLLQSGLSTRFDVVISGDSLPQRKPHPAPVLEACRRLGVAVHEAVMVGDDARDIESALAAGAHAIAVSFGYTSNDEDISLWGAQSVIDVPADLLEWITAHDTIDVGNALSP